MSPGKSNASGGNGLPGTRKSEWDEPRVTDWWSRAWSGTWVSHGGRWPGAKSRSLWLDSATYATRILVTHPDFYSPWSWDSKTSINETACGTCLIKNLWSSRYSWNSSIKQTKLKASHRFSNVGSQSVKPSLPPSSLWCSHHIPPSKAFGQADRFTDAPVPRELSLVQCWVGKGLPWEYRTGVPWVDCKLLGASWPYGIPLISVHTKFTETAVVSRNWI